MIGDIMLPDLLVANIGTEPRDFSVKAGRSQPLRNSMGLIIFGLVWLAFTSIFVFAFLGPLFSGNEVHFTADNVPVVASPQNLKPIIMPSVILGIFVLVGLLLLASGLVSLFKKGGYFVGTSTRLINFRNGTIRSIDWEQFTGDIEVSGNQEKGNIKLVLRTGKMVSRKNKPDEYVPDTLYISAIPDVFAVETLCRKRIKENDPTPVMNEQNVN